MFTVEYIHLKKKLVSMSRLMHSIKICTNQGERVNQLAIDSRVMPQLVQFYGCSDVFKKGNKLLHQLFILIQHFTFDTVLAHEIKVHLQVL